MKRCSQCFATQPDDARYCMQCGSAFPQDSRKDAGQAPATAGFGALGLSLAASLLVSFVLIYVFRLPVFLLFGVLPLLWWRRKQ